MRHQVQWPRNQEGSGSPSSRKPPTSSESRTPAASRPGVAQRTPAQPRSGPRSPAVATKPKMRILPKAQTFDQSSQSNKRKAVKATQWSQSTKSAPTETRSGASSRSPNCAPNQIIIAGSTSRTNRSISRCPFRLPNKVNRCLARYSPRATTTNQPTNRAPNEPARPGPKWTKMPILGHIWSFLQKAAGLTITIVIWIGLSNTQLVNLNQNLFKYEETAMLSKERATHLLNPPLPRSRLAY